MRRKKRGCVLVVCRIFGSLYGFKGLAYSRWIFTYIERDVCARV